ncbi:MAG TPA: TlpA disulfide reductase family protein [Micromonosporaceae bacterium]
MRTLPSRINITAAAVVLLAGLAALAGCSGGSPAVASPVQVVAAADRQPAPQLRGELLDGSGSYDLAQREGDVVVVNFWGSWCAPCVAEADDLEQTYLATKDARVSFLGVNIRDERDKARSFTTGRATYPSVFDPSGSLALGFSVPPTLIPTTFIIDRQGRIAVVIRSAVLRADLEALVRQVAAEGR